MFKKKDNTYKFISGKKEYGVDVLNDNTIEVYEENDPSNTGFILRDKKAITAFINNFTDVVEDINQDALEKEMIEQEKALKG